MPARRSCSVVSIRVDMGLRSIGPAGTPDGMGREVRVLVEDDQAVRPGGGAELAGVGRTTWRQRVRFAEGSNASRIPSPIRLIDSTMIRIARPGK